LETLDMARIHEGALNMVKVSSGRGAFIDRAERLFTQAVTHIEKTHGAAVKASVQVQTLDCRTADVLPLLRHGRYVNVALSPNFARAMFQTSLHRVMKETQAG
jgi:hypothetical protein